MRYSVGSPDYSYTIKVVSLANATGIQEAHRCGLVFCNLVESQVEFLRDRGMSVKPIRTIAATDIGAPRPVEPTGGTPLTGAGAVYASALEEVRNIFSPPMMGSGYNMAILDSGIRASHIGFEDRVFYSKNFTSSPSVEDVYDHGTSVAWLAAAGPDENGVIQGMAPAAGILNIKVLGDDGMGTEESVVLGIEHLLDLDDGKKPCAINMSLGAPDDGDPDNPVRVACRAAYAEDIFIFVAAGNDGPDSKTILCPATEPIVFAVGALSPTTSEIFAPSSRGPTLEGEIKPDGVFYGDDLYLASSKGDTSYLVKAGTSFAVAGISGISVLAAEIRDRYLGKVLAMPGTPYGFTMEPGWSWLWEHLDKVCAKPEGAPVEKDNTYGWGIPMGNLVLEHFSPMVQAGLFEMVMPIMMMAIMMPVIIKSMR